MTRWQLMRFVYDMETGQKKKLKVPNHSQPHSQSHSQFHFLQGSHQGSWKIGLRQAWQRALLLGVARLFQFEPVSQVRSNTLSQTRPPTRPQNLDECLQCSWR